MFEWAAMPTYSAPNRNRHQTLIPPMASTSPEFIEFEKLLKRLKKRYWRHGMTTSVVNRSGASAQAVTVTEDTLSIDLENGRTISVPLLWFPRLLHATRKKKLIGGSSERGKAFIGKSLMRIFALKDCSQGNLPERVSRLLKND